MLIACDNDVTQADDAIDVQVTATSFSPPLLTIEPADSTAGGEDSALPITVAWEFTGGPHNIVFEDGLSSGNRTDGTFERDFSDAQAGVYRYRCTLHSSDFLTGQVGQVVVIQ
jgi:plastocyanin